MSNFIKDVRHAYKNIKIKKHNKFCVEIGKLQNSECLFNSIAIFNQKISGVSLFYTGGKHKK